MGDVFRQRILYDGPLEDVMVDVCEEFSIGSYRNHGIIRRGYEDLNLRLETDEDSFLVKIFMKTRSDGDCRKYVDIMREAVEIGVKHPQLLENGDGHLHIFDFDGGYLRLCVMEYIEGTTFEKLDRGLTEEEIRFLAEQAALINSMESEPHDKWDSWAITNFLYEFGKTHAFLDEKDQGMIEPLVKQFREVDLDSLPHCFVHNDIRETNIVKAENGDLWVLDFSVADIYPRVQEIAVAATSILYGGNQEKTGKNLEIFLDEYQKHSTLTEEELEVLPLFMDVGTAIEVIRPTFEKDAKGNDSEENEYWLRQGRKKLEQRLG